MAEGEGLEPTSPKAPVFKTGALPITLALRRVLAGVIVLCAGGFVHACAGHAGCEVLTKVKKMCKHRFFHCALWARAVLRAMVCRRHPQVGLEGVDVL